MMKMYVDGRCPDTSYFYPWRFAPQSEHIAAWIQEQLRNQTAGLENSFQDVAVPVSDMPYLSPTAVAMTVLPWTNITDERMIASNLRDAWQAVQNELFDHPSVDFRSTPFGNLYRPPLPSLQYENLITRLEDIFQRAAPQPTRQTASQRQAQTLQGSAVPATTKEPFGAWYVVSHNSALDKTFRLPRRPVATRVSPDATAATIFRIPGGATVRPYHQPRPFDPYVHTAGFRHGREHKSLGQVAMSSARQPRERSLPPNAPGPATRPVRVVRRVRCVRRVH